MLSLATSKTDKKIIKYLGKALNSLYDPISESERFINSKFNLLNNNYIVVYGVGSGYHIRYLLEMIDENTIIYVFEYNYELFNLFISINNDIIKDKRVKFINKKNKKFFEIFRMKLNLVDDIIVHKPSLNTIKNSDSDIYELINNYEKHRISIEKNKDKLIENLNYNLSCNCESISNVIEKNNFNKWILVAGGPSLDLTIDGIKRIKKMYKIIVVGTALRTLIKNKIKPDIIVIIDGMDGVREQFRGVENLSIPLCFLSTASKEAIKVYKGPKYIFFNEDSELIIKTGKTVAVAALDIAIKLGAEEIILLGQDLGYIGGKTHLKLFEEMYGVEDIIKIEKNFPKVLDINGEYIDTTEGYLYFKKQIENLIEDNQKINFINCSKGAFIKGCEHKDINEII